MAQQATAPAARRSPPRVVEVLRVSDLSPHYRRITLGGPALADYPAGMAGAHLKLFLRRPGQAELALPSFGPNGPAWPPREQRPFVRTYTIRRHDAAAGELDLEFVLHGDNGPASAWAAAAKPGDQVGISGPGRREEQVLSADWRLLAGDLSALPAIAAYLEALPADARGVALVEVPGPEDELELARPAGVELVWLHQNGVAPAQSRLLVEAVRRLAWPTGGSRFAWVAGEAAQVVAIRDMLRAERGLDRASLYAVPFWKAGLDEEAYHDERHRVMDEA